MKIQDCKNITDYLKMCGVKSVDKLTNEQVFAWAYAGKMGVETEIAVGIVEHGMNGRMPDVTKAVKLLKQAIKENKKFTCAYIMPESCEPIEETDDNAREYFGMSVY